MNTVLVIMLFTGHWTPVRAIEYPTWEACANAAREQTNPKERVVCAPLIQQQKK